MERRHKQLAVGFVIHWKKAESIEKHLRLTVRATRLPLQQHEAELI